MAKYKLDTLGFIGYVLEVTKETVIFYGTTGRILKQSIDRFGYLVVNMESFTESHTQRVHRIVAKICVVNPRDLPIVLHKDNNKLNCHPDNLRWGTFEENNRQCYAENRNPGNTKKMDDVLLIKEYIIAGLSYTQIIESCAALGVKVSRGTITRYKKLMASKCND